MQNMLPYKWLYCYTPLYNFIKGILSDESAALRHLSVHRILFGFRCLELKLMVVYK